MDYQQIAREYLNRLQNDIELSSSTGESTPELSFRTSLDLFFNNLINYFDGNIGCIHEPRNQNRAGRPDWRFHNKLTMGVYGFVEHKPLDTQNRISYTDHSTQIDKYLQLNQRVILTDGIDLILFKPGSDEPDFFSVIPKPFENISDQEVDLLSENCFREFFDSIGFRECSEIELIKEIAIRTRRMADEISELVGLEPDEGFDDEERETISILHNLKEVVESHHHPSFEDNNIFSDFVAQILSFGLLFSHRVVRCHSNQPDQLYDEIHNFWSSALQIDFNNHLRPFKALIDSISNELESPLRKVGSWYDNIRCLLAHVRLQDDQRENPDYHNLYEQFLSVFDPQTRFDYGAFYTPSVLSKFMVGFSHAIANVELQDSSLFNSGNKLIDPCCGTGSFLEQLFISSDGNIEDAVTIGFEILPAPYALAHYRIGMLNNFEYPENFNLILTNTLSDTLEERASSTSTETNLIIDEQNTAKSLVRVPLTLIIGNPPSSDSIMSMTNDGASIVSSLIDDWRPPANQRAGRQNIQKQLQNEFIKFLRWSCNKALDSDNSILMLILPGSFAKNISYKYSRKWLSENFTKIWVLEFDKDSRTGAPTSNFFPTLQGRLIIACLKTNSGNNQTIDNFFFKSVADFTKDEKWDFFDTQRTDNEYFDLFSEIETDPEDYSFKPLREYDRDQFNKFWKLCSDNPSDDNNYIFQRHCSGVKFAPSSIFVHVNEGLLRRRSREIADTSNSYSDLKPRWFSGQDRPPAETKFQADIRSCIGDAVRGGDRIVQYCYRPFTNTYALLDEVTLRELASVGGGGSRFRPELVRAYKDDETIGIAIAPSPGEIGEHLHRFASFVWNTPDNDLAKRCNAHVFCNQFPEYKRANTTWDSTPAANINPKLIDYVKLNSECSDLEASNKIIYYVYGILCSESYLNKFEAPLFNSSSRWPRIPIPQDYSHFDAISTKGKTLAQIEKDDIDLDADEDFGELYGLYVEAFELAKKSHGDGQQIVLIDNNNNERIKIDNLPSEVVSFEISGYKVINQWLKINSYPYTRAPFSQRQYRGLLKLLCKIKKQLSTIQALEPIVETILSDDTIFFQEEVN